MPQKEIYTSKYEYGEKIIQVRHVDKNFEVVNDYIKVIKDVTFDVYEGEFIIICGPSGSGKSTLLHMINGWEEPTYGDVLIEGNDIYAVDEDERIKICNDLISIVDQQPHWIGSLDALANIEVPFLLSNHSRKDARKRSKKLISLLALDSSGNHKPVDLSGGQQQRISLLRALISNPKVIIADEPTGALDAKSADALIDILLRINTQLNRTIIMATHNLSLLKYATRVIQIVDGKIDKTLTIQRGFKSQKASGDILDIRLEDKAANNEAVV